MCGFGLRDAVRPLFGKRFVFPKEDVCLERQNLIDTIESEFNDKREYAINKCLSLMFDGSPLAVKNTGPGKKRS